MAFKFQPHWQGPLPGRSFEKQTEDAINALQTQVDRVAADLAGIEGYGDFARLSYTALSANETIYADAENSMQVFVCTGNVTLTLLAANSNTSWILVKNAGTGNVTLHPATPSITIDGSPAEVKLAPNEYVQIIGQAAGAYLVISDGRWPTAIEDVVGSFRYMG